MLLVSLPVPPPSPLPPSSPQQQPSPQQPQPEHAAAMTAAILAALPMSLPLSPQPVSPVALAARQPRDQHLPSTLFSFHPMRRNHRFCGHRVRVSGCRRLGGRFRNA